MKRLIINADDFGLCQGCNQGIIKAIKDGVVTSTTLMINMPYAQKAISLVKQNDLKCIGLHLSLTCGRPISNIEKVESLITDEGEFSRELIHSNSNIHLEEVELELENQIREFLSNYIKPTHLDTHHHIHTNQKIRSIIIKLAKKYNLPLRFVNEETKLEIKRSKIKTTDYFSMDFYGGNKISIDYFKNIINRLPDGIIEIMCHPAQRIDELKEISSYSQEREKELEVLTSDKLKKWLKEEEIKLINFSDV
ncbi:chitin disaccharide deacetylase [Halanaerocella petrolearia]